METERRFRCYRCVKAEVQTEPTAPHSPQEAQRAAAGGPAIELEGPGSRTGREAGGVPLAFLVQMRMCALVSMPALVACMRAGGLRAALIGAVAVLRGQAFSIRPAMSVGPTFTVGASLFGNMHIALIAPQVAHCCSRNSGGRLVCNARCECRRVVGSRQGSVEQCRRGCQFVVWYSTAAPARSGGSQCATQPCECRKSCRILSGKCRAVPLRTSIHSLVSNLTRLYPNKSSSAAVEQMQALRRFRPP